MSPKQYSSRMVVSNNGVAFMMMIIIIIAAHAPIATAWLARTSFQPPLVQSSRPQQNSLLLYSVSSRASTSTSNDVAASIQQDCKTKMLEYSQQTQSGQSSKTAPQSLLDEIEACLQTLERTTPLSAPARSPLVFGKWLVRYTDAPPPSNGQLGIFSGLAYQTVEGTCYTNLLEVPPNKWLSAALQARWEEWDGTLLDKQISVTAATRNKEPSKWNNPSSSLQPPPPTALLDPNTDFGATCWKVTFEKLDIALLGFNVVQQVFPPTTQRIWRTTYVDDDTRIVRAGTTGLPEDEYVFYMTREV